MYTDFDADKIAALKVHLQDVTANFKNSVNLVVALHDSHGSVIMPEMSRFSELNSKAMAAEKVLDYIIRYENGDAMDKRDLLFNMNLDLTVSLNGARNIDKAQVFNACINFLVGDQDFPF